MMNKLEAFSALVMQICLFKKLLLSEPSQLIFCLFNASQKISDALNI